MTDYIYFLIAKGTNAAECRKLKYVEHIMRNGAKYELLKCIL